MIRYQQINLHARVPRHRRRRNCLRSINIGSSGRRPAHQIVWSELVDKNRCNEFLSRRFICYDQNESIRFVDKITCYQTFSSPVVPHNSADPIALIDITWSAKEKKSINNQIKIYLFDQIKIYLFQVLFKKYLQTTVGKYCFWFNNFCRKNWSPSFCHTHF